MHCTAAQLAGTHPPKPWVAASGRRVKVQRHSPAHLCLPSQPCLPSRRFAARQGRCNALVGRSVSSCGPVLGACACSLAVRRAPVAPGGGCRRKRLIYLHPLTPQAAARGALFGAVQPGRVVLHAQARRLCFRLAAGQRGCRRHSWWVPPAALLLVPCAHGMLFALEGAANERGGSRLPPTASVSKWAVPGGPLGRLEVDGLMLQGPSDGEPGAGRAHTTGEQYQSRFGDDATNHDGAAPPCSCAAGKANVLGVHHVALICRNLENSLEFYQGVLGEPGSGTGRPKGHGQPQRRAPHESWH